MSRLLQTMRFRIWGGRFALGLLVLSVAPAAGVDRAEAAPAAAPMGADVVRTDLGAVQGAARHGVLEFRGIPYAAAPVGALRWRGPQPARPWSGVRDASKFGSACPQLHRFHLTDESLDEDCLTLNVSVPTGAHRAVKHAVLVWIHGGAFVGGSSNLYRLDKLAREGDLVVVSINYRLGVLGFMPHAAFDSDDNGAYGLEDQRAALRWVQRNIGAFGGDPGNVTIAGESAGAGSICMHLASPDAVRGLFAKAIIMSGGCLQPMPGVAVAADEVGARVAAAVGCTDQRPAAACLRRAPLQALLHAGDELSSTRIITFAPSIGSGILPRQAGEALRAGEILRVPTLVGGARDELRLYIGYEEQAGRHVTRANFPEKVAGYYGALAPKVLGEYPLPEDESPPAYLGSLLSDYNPFVGINNCLYLETASTLARHSPVYEFEFSDPDAPVLGVGMVAQPDPHFPLGAVHSAMLNYLFPNMSNTAKIDAPDLPAASQKLSDSMVALWARFVAAGVPAAPDVPVWPRFTGDATVMRLEPGRIGVFDAATAHRCSFWRGLYPDRL